MEFSAAYRSPQVRTDSAIGDPRTIVHSLDVPSDVVVVCLVHLRQATNVEGISPRKAVTRVNLVAVCFLAISRLTSDTACLPEIKAIRGETRRISKRCSASSESRKSGVHAFKALLSYQ